MAHLPALPWKEESIMISRFFVLRNGRMKFPLTNYSGEKKCRRKGYQGANKFFGYFIFDTTIRHPIGMIKYAVQGRNADEAIYLGVLSI